MDSWAGPALWWSTSRVASSSAGLPPRWRSTALRRAGPSPIGSGMSTAGRSPGVRPRRASVPPGRSPRSSHRCRGRRGHRDRAGGRLVVGRRVVESQGEIADAGSARRPCGDAAQDVHCPTAAVPERAGMPGVAEGKAVAIGQVRGHDRRGEPPQLRVRGELLVQGRHQSRLALAVDIPAQERGSIPENSATDSPWPETSATIIRVTIPPPQSET